MDESGKLVERAEDLERLQANLGVRFRDPGLLARAVTHSSFEGGGPLAGNERLEFLGDAVLKLAAASYLYSEHPEMPEGELSSSLGRMVSEKALAEAASRLGLGEFLRLGRSLELTGGRTLPSVLADAFEAILGAIFLDRGFRVAARIVATFLGPSASVDDESGSPRNYKAILQEIFQKREKQVPGYRVVAETGPDHDKTFEVEAVVESRAVGRGTGKTKKQAEQAAAKDALCRMGAEIPHVPGEIRGGEALERQGSSADRR